MLFGGLVVQHVGLHGGSVGAGWMMVGVVEGLATANVVRSWLAPWDGLANT